MNKKTITFTVFIFALFVSALFSWKLLWPKYQHYQAIRFLDDQFHILKSKNEIIKLEKLTFSHKYEKAIYKNNKTVQAEAWVYLRPNQEKVFSFQKEKFYSLHIFYPNLDNPVFQSFKILSQKKLGPPKESDPNFVFFRWKFNLNTTKTITLTISRPLDGNINGYELRLN